MSGDTDLSYNMNEICRLCLKGDVTILPIFGLEHSSRDCIPLSRKIKACVSVEISQHDNLPKKICVACVTQVDSWHRFKISCDSAQNKLHSWVKPQGTNSAPLSDQIQASVKEEQFDIDEHNNAVYNENSASQQPNDVICIDDDDNDGKSTSASRDNAKRKKNQKNQKRTDSSNLENDLDDDYIDNVSMNGNDTDDDNSRNNDSYKEKSNERGSYSKGMSKSREKDVNRSSEKVDKNKADGEDEGFISDERMIADFIDELSPEVQLNSSTSEKDISSDAVANDTDVTATAPSSSTEMNDITGSEVLNKDSVEDVVKGNQEMSTDDRPNAELSNHNDEIQVNEKSSDNSNNDSGIKLLKDKSSNIIDRISMEINRRLSSDNEDAISSTRNIDQDSTGNNSRFNRTVEDFDDDNDDHYEDNNIDEDEEEDEEDEVVFEKRELRPRNNNRNMYDYPPDSTTSSESGLLISEGFSLSQTVYHHNDNVDELSRNSGGRQRKQPDDLESVITVDYSEHNNMVQSMSGNSDMVYNIKQEPASPDANPVDYNVKKEMLDWSSLPPEPIDIKPDITLLEGNQPIVINSGGHKKRRRFPHYENGVPCEPCRSTYPNYFKWLRHTKSHKHQRNVRYFEMTGKVAESPSSMNPAGGKIHGGSSMTMQTVQNPPRVATHGNYIKNPCPIGNCQSTFKHRRNLLTHVKHAHGFRLKDLEVNSEARVNHITTASKESIKSTGVSNAADSDEEAGAGGDNQTSFKCSHCPKVFSLRKSLKSHLLIKHRISSITAKLRCDRCFKNFHRKTGLLSHMRSCGKYVKSRKCPYCAIVLPTHKEWAQHKARCDKRYAPLNPTDPVSPLKNVNKFNMMPNEDGTFSCLYCNISFEVQSVYYNHMEMYHSGAGEEDTADNPPVEEEDDLNKNNLLDEDNKESAIKSENQEQNNDVNHIELVTDKMVPVIPNSGDIDDEGKYVCRYCVKTFTNVEDLQNHIDYHDVNKIFQCKLCYLVLNCKRYFQDHMRSHFIQHRGQYLCWTCFKPFNNRKDLSAHKNLHVKLKIFKCKVCNRSFNNTLMLEKHKRSHDRDEIMSSLNENDEVELQMDETKEDENVPNFKCNVCKKNFSSEEALSRHSKLHNPVRLEVIKKFVQICSNCRLTFKTTLSYREHIQHCNPNSANLDVNNGTGLDENDRDIKPNINPLRTARVQCDKCLAVFSNIMSLRKHKNYNRCPLVKNHHDSQTGNIKIFYCKYCKKSCQTILGLYRHLRGCKIMHLKRTAAGADSQNSCFKCKKQFSSIGVLFNHEKFCNVKPDPDDIDENASQTGSKVNCGNCNTEFYNKESLERHLKYCKVFGGISTQENASGEKFYHACNTCNRKFTTSVSYKLHKKLCNEAAGNMQNTINSLSCRGCGRNFITKDRLRLHEKVCRGLRNAASLVMLSQRPDLHTCLCGKAFTTKSLLSTHKETCQVSSTYGVSNVSESVSFGSSGQTGITPNKVWTCEYCYKQFNKYQAKNSHMRVCKVKLSLKYSPGNKGRAPIPRPIVNDTPSIVPAFTCLSCKGSFETEQYLIEHTCQEFRAGDTETANIITVEPDLPQDIFNMQSPPPTITTYQTMSKQFGNASKVPRKDAKCIPCNKIFSCYSALNKHTQIFHGQASQTANSIVNYDGSIQCPKCPRSFRDHTSLTHHMGWHTRQGGFDTSSHEKRYQPLPSDNSTPPQQGQYSCRFCNRKFLGKGPLQNHIKSHMNNMVAAPPSNNSSSPSIVLDDDFEQTSQSSNAASSSSSKSRGGNFKCKICPKVFRDKMSLINHHNLHKNVLPSNSLKAKILSRAGKTYVSCHICNKILSSNSINKHNKLHMLRQDTPLSAFAAQPETYSVLQQPEQDQHQQHLIQLAKNKSISITPTSSSSSALLPCGFCFKLFKHDTALNEHILTTHASFDDNPSLQEKQIINEIDAEDDDDVMLVEEDEMEEPQYQSEVLEEDPLLIPTMTMTTGENDYDENIIEDDEDDDEDGTDNLYKCEICDKSWKHKSVYLRHINAPSHKELTKRLSDIISRVNHDVTEHS